MVKAEHIDIRTTQRALSKKATFFVASNRWVSTSKNDMIEAISKHKGWSFTAANLLLNLCKRMPKKRQAAKSKSERGPGRSTGERKYHLRNIKGLSVEAAFKAKEKSKRRHKAAKNGGYKGCGSSE